MNLEASDFQRPVFVKYFASNWRVITRMIKIFFGKNLKNANFDSSNPSLPLWWKCLIL